MSVPWGRVDPVTDDSAARRVPEKALDTTPDSPWPVRLIAEKIRAYIDRMPPVWVEGQVVQLNRRSTRAYLTLRDADLDISVSVNASTRTVDATTAPMSEGSTVVAHVKPEYWLKRGSLQMAAKEFRTVGIGELLARIEELRRVLTAEGVFDRERKKPLPFLPAVVGLICGRDSKAEHDVVVNARERWPHVRFEIREVAVQGADAVPQVSAALAELDGRPEVEVIVIARGGGAVEDLLPFSNEKLVRAVASASTPVVSAIGHETDAPLLDLVADYRASTPTDAAKTIVPDVAAERAGIAQSRERMARALERLVDREQHGLTATRSRPVLARPATMVEDRETRVHADIERARHAVRRRVLGAEAEIGRLEGQVRALSPHRVLSRGYALVQTSAGSLVRSVGDVTAGDSLHVRLADGQVDATATSTTSGPAVPTTRGAPAHPTASTTGQEIS